MATWRRPIAKVIVYLWASPYTCLGLALGLVLAGKFRIVAGVVEIHGPRVAAVLERLWIPAAAITLGHTVLGQSEDWLCRTRTHERVHVRQYQRWGPLFVPAYLLASVALFAVGKNGYLCNPFEREAFASQDRH